MIFSRAGPDRHAVHLDWLQSVELRRRVHAGLNKGEARNSLAGGVLQPP
ncbi:Tn3 family transposase [Salmonella enterica subsp. enterica]|nr:Tn3 family transposase [Salmonella enterica subsp. enterica]